MRWFILFCFASMAWASHYVLPEVLFTPQAQSRITIVNLEQETATVTLSGYGEDRQVHTTAPFQLAPQGMRQFAMDTLFGEAASDVAWIEVLGDLALDVTVETKEPGTQAAYRSTENLWDSLFMPHIAQNTSLFSTHASVVNCSNTGVTAVIDPKPQGAQVLLTDLGFSHSLARKNLLDLWPSLEGLQWGHIRGVTPALAAMERFGYLDQPRLAALGLNGQVGKTLRFLHVATNTDLFWTGMVYLNLGSYDAYVTETYYNSQGQVIKEEIPDPLPPGGKVTLLFDATHQDRVPAGTSWVKVTSIQNLVGYELFGSPNEGTDETFAGLQGSYESASRLVYPYYTEESGAWVGYVAVNVGEASDDLVFSLVNEQGQVLASHTVPNLAPNQKVTSLGTDLFGTAGQGQSCYVVADAVNSTFAGFVLWGNDGTPRTHLSGVNAALGDNPMLVDLMAPYFGTGHSTPVLIEQFTASNCGPCGYMAEELSDWWTDYTYEEMVWLRYAAWSSDPYYTTINSRAMSQRATYYQVQAVPTVVTEGLYTIVGAGNTRPQLDNMVGYRENANHPFGLAIQGTISGNSEEADGALEVSVTFPDPGLNGSYALHVAVVEKEYHFERPPGSNGQTAFHGNMLQYFPSNGQGELLSGASGETKSFSFTFDADALNVHPPTHLCVIAFVQNVSSKEVVGVAFFGYEP